MPSIRPTRAALTVATFEDAITHDGSDCDLSRVTFVDTFGLVGVAVAIAAAVRDGGPGSFIRPSAVQTAEHLTYMGLRGCLAGLGINTDLPDVPVASATSVVVPLQIIHDVSAVERLSHLVHAQLDGSVNPQVLVALTESLWELGANALEHSGSPAIVAGQLYLDGRPPDHDNTVQIVIGDTGKGIRQSFLDGGGHRPTNDLEAIRLAVQYLVSSVPDPGRGQGLTTTIEETIGLGGRVVVRSGTGRLSLVSQDETGIEVAQLPGTIVGVVLPVRPSPRTS